MESVYTQPWTETDIVNGVLVYGESTSDIWGFLKTAEAVDELLINLPADPNRRGDQTFGFSTKFAINNLTFAAGTDIFGAPPSFFPAGSKVGFTFNPTHEAWFATT